MLLSLSCGLFRRRGVADGFGSVFRVEEIRKQNLVTITGEKVRKLAAQTVIEAVSEFEIVGSYRFRQSRLAS
ncbi:hypothetical protein N184_33960 [Sinorhizobium sp. GL28]|nr:hypothetical protein N184_33960 [Sinorhizobium sp. GL28]